MLKATLTLKGQNYGRFRIAYTIGPTVKLIVYANDHTEARTKMAELLHDVEVLPYETTTGDIRDDFIGFPLKAIERLDMTSFVMPLHLDSESYIPVISWEVSEFVENEFVCIVQ